jgi:hypothetical protein
MGDQPPKLPVSWHVLPLDPLVLSDQRLAVWRPVLLLVLRLCLCCWRRVLLRWSSRLQWEREGPRGEGQQLPFALQLLLLLSLPLLLS